MAYVPKSYKSFSVIKREKEPEKVRNIEVCFGDYTGKDCVKHWECPKQTDCMIEASLNGPCDCPHKRNCHVPRQMLSTSIREESGETIEQCNFYKYFV